MIIPRRPVAEPAISTAPRDMEGSKCPYYTEYWTIYCQ
jgi:hypothetical protein